MIKEEEAAVCNRSKRLRRRRNHCCSVGYRLQLAVAMAASILSLLSFGRSHVSGATTVAFVAQHGPMGRHGPSRVLLTTTTTTTTTGATKVSSRPLVQSTMHLVPLPFNGKHNCLSSSSRDSTWFGLPRLSLRLFSSSSTTTTKGKEKKLDTDLQQEVYQELQWLSREIRRHDALYYNNNNNDDSKIDGTMITDDDYDALVRREQDICHTYPELQQKWEDESGWGKEATRVGGRVGIGSAAGGDTTSTTSDEGVATTVAAATTTISTTAPRFQKRIHLIPMLSLDNVTDRAQLDAWLERLRKKLIATTISNDDDDSDANGGAPSLTILTEPKLDGLSLSLRYKLIDDVGGGSYFELVWACTRGDGKKGQDVTQPVKEGMKLPLKLAAGIDDRKQQPMMLPDIFEIRGEVVLPRSTFRNLREQATLEAAAAANQENNETTTTPTLQSFSNARNAASGILLRKADKVVDENNDENASRNRTTSTAANTTLQLQSMLQFYAYDMVADVDGEVVEWLRDALICRQRLQDWGFQVANPIAVTTLGLKETRNETSVNKENDNEDTGETALVEFEPWAEQDIQPMLGYHQALGQHREELHQQDEVAAIQQKKTSPKKGASKKKKFGFGDYDMDGCVHKVSQVSLRRLLGNSNRAPRWAVAHKFPSQSAITALMAIEVQVGRKSGALTPVAILEPVELAGGVTVTRATLHNFQHMQQLLCHGSATEAETESLATTPVDSQHPMFLGKGSKVLVRRAGDVIPQVVQLAEPPKYATDQKTLLKSSSWIDLSAPSRCPACGSQTVVDIPVGNGTSSQSGRGQILRCGGPQLLCSPRAIGALVHAYSRDALDISGLSEAKIQHLSTVNSTLDGNRNETDAPVNTSLIKLRYPSDIFKLAKDPEAIEAIAGLPGWGPKSAQNLANCANKVASEGVSLSRFINSLAIRYAGVRSSKIIATAYGTATAFLDAVECASQVELGDSSSEPDPQEDERQKPFGLLADKDNEVNRGIGPSLLSALAAFSRESELVQAANDLASVVNVLDDDDFQPDGAGESPRNENEDSQALKPFYGMKVVFTGSLASMDLTRKEAQGLAKSMGAKATPGTISKATDIVVVGDKSGVKKLDTARALGVRIVEVEEFLELARDFQSKLS